MDDDAQEAAWQRIEAALTRLDTAAQARLDVAASGRRDDAALASQLRDEQARHTALRHALRETLGRMDDLIAAHTPAPYTPAPYTPHAEDSAA